METIVALLAQFLAVVVVLTFHEFAHAYAAYKCGDPTAKFCGRMSLNPAKHFDPIGLFAFVFAGFGWAKPVPINPNNFDNYKKGAFWTALAGVLTNYIMAFLFYPVFVLTWIYVLPLFAGKYMAYFLYALTWGLFIYSLSFCVFNLIPLYPLDGFRIVDATTTRKGKIYWILRQYGQYILMGLILVHFAASRIPYFGYIDLLGYGLSFAENVFGKPITLFWDWIFQLILS